MSRPAAEFDVVLGGIPRFAAESPWAWRLARRYLHELPARKRTELFGVRPTVSQAAGESSIVLVQADPEAYLAPVAAERLVSAVLRGGCDAAVPVTNEPWSEEARRDPPFAYHTPSLLDEAARAVAASGGPPRPGAAASPVFSIRRDALRALPSELPLDEAVAAVAARRGSVVVEPGAYLHRYGEMDGQSRDDLVARIPQGAVSVLDVGCSRGATAGPLRRAGVREIVGIEPDPGDAAEAARTCDRVLAVPLEEVSEDFSRRFDAVLFGDVLEHLEDPTGALLKVRPWLSGRGRVVASVPNLGHWSIVADLLAGRFDYVPYSILSGTHVRFFTRSTLVDLFEACGYERPAIDGVRFEPSPAGRAVLQRLQAIPGASEDLDVVEFVASASTSRASG